MSIEIGIIFICLNLLLWLSLTKNFFHPSVIISLEWLVIISLVFINQDNFYTLSNITISIICVWVIIFCVTSFFISRVRWKIPIGLSKKQLINFPLKSLYLPLLFSNIFLIFLIVQRFGFSFINIREGLLRPLPIYLKTMFYINTFSYAYFAVLCSVKKISKTKVMLFAFVLIISSFAKTNKTTFISFFSLILFLLYSQKKLSFKKIILLLLSMFVLIGLVVIIRGDMNTVANFSIVKYLTIYILSPVVAFDQIVKGDIGLPPWQFGGHVFILIYRILSVLTRGVIHSQTFSVWIYHPVPTNVYTTLAPYYIDFGVLGIALFAFLQGIFWGVVYGMQKSGYVYYKILYGLLLYSLLLQFFSDYFVYTLSVVVQYIIFTILLTGNIRDLKYIKYKGTYER